MAFRLKKSGSLRANLKRLLRRQLDKAEESTGANDQPRAENAHSIRKSFKRIRAILRLLRPCLGNSEYRKVNDCFRDTARTLATVRDAKVIVEALDKLMDQCSEPGACEAGQKLRQVLQEQQTAIQSHILNEANAFSRIKQTIAQERGRVGDWAIPSEPWSAVHRGLKRVYRQSRDACQQAWSQSTPEMLHEWRKKAKYLWHQLEMLERFSKSFARLALELHELTGLLGDDHDLLLLRDKTEKTLAGLDQAGGKALMRLIDNRRKELQAEAFRLGSALFRQTAQEFDKQVRRKLAKKHLV